LDQTNKCRYLPGIPAEVVMAYALLKVEPPKIEGGSLARRRWLALMMEIEVYLLQTPGIDFELFKDTLLESS
jgi:hypothetical protein